MNKLSSQQIRKMWLDFWADKGHQVVPSKSLIPVNDPSLLWINSGVATLKDYFSGKTKPKNPRITNTQAAIRTNDIENVGVTARHHTMFEMLGNFSVGEYFKKEALTWAFEFLFEVLELEQDKIYITYFSEDTDTYKKWMELGIKEDHLIKGDRDTNFWDLGQGPCGPDTEIFYDRGMKYDRDNKGIEMLIKDEENDRYIEIWNIVFSEFNNDGNGNYNELVQKNIDTGAGLERIVSIFQDAPTNFDTDLFLPIIKNIEAFTEIKYKPFNYFQLPNKITLTNKHFKVIADHIRAVSCAIQDGAKPSNVSRGYIIRRLIRRAYRSGKQLGIKQETFLEYFVPVVTEVLPHLTFDVEKIQAILIKEQKSFANTIKQGQALLDKSIEGKTELDVKTAYKLFETYGFPIELTKEILGEKNIKLDLSQYDKLVDEHAQASKGKVKNLAMEKQIAVIEAITDLQSTFIGYDKLESESKVIFSGQENNQWYVLLDQTPFYPTGGGQEHDHGVIDGQEVKKVFKDKHGNVWHVLDKDVKGTIKAAVAADVRINKERNHTATHLLAEALKTVIQADVVQLGSYNDESKLRFDFPATKKPTEAQLEEVEAIVNKYIVEGHKRKYIETDMDGAVKLGAVKLEGETYADVVRVVDLGVSKEFCGGTHVASTKDIEKFKITKLETKGSGVYRIHAITSNEKVEEFETEEIKHHESILQQELVKIKNLVSKYKIKYDKTIDGIKEAILKIKADKKKHAKENKKVVIDFDAIKFDVVDGKQVHIRNDANPSTMKGEAISLREHFPDALIILHSEQIGLVAVASKKYDSLQEAVKQFPEFKGGGNANFAMGKAK